MYGCYPASTPAGTSSGCAQCSFIARAASRRVWDWGEHTLGMDPSFNTMGVVKILSISFLAAPIKHWVLAGVVKVYKLLALLCVKECRQTCLQELSCSKNTSTPGRVTALLHQIYLCQKQKQQAKTPKSKLVTLGSSVRAVSLLKDLQPSDLKLTLNILCLWVLRWRICTNSNLWHLNVFCCLEQIPVACWEGKLWVRISAQFYNELADYQALADAIAQVQAEPPLANGAWEVEVVCVGMQVDYVYFSFSVYIQCWCCSYTRLQELQLFSP